MCSQDGIAETLTVGKRLLCNAYGLCNSRLCAIYVLFYYRDLFRY